VELELTLLSLLSVAGPLPATVAPPRRGDAAAEPNFFSSPSTRSSGELACRPSCPVGRLTVVGALPPPLAPSPPLWHRRRLRRDARTRAVTAPTSATLRRAIVGRAAHAGRARAVNTGRARVGVCRARAVHMGRADAASVGQVPLCNWAERGFGPVTLELVFLISEYIQILSNLKIYVGFI
jgi:hypothetical protein